MSRRRQWQWRQWQRRLRSGDSGGRVRAGQAPGSHWLSFVRRVPALPGSGDFLEPQPAHQWQRGGEVLGLSSLLALPEDRLGVCKRLRGAAPGPQYPVRCGGDEKPELQAPGASTVVAAGLTIAAAGFAGRYVLQAMESQVKQVKQVFPSVLKSAFSGGYYGGGFELRMTKWEATLILGVSPTANKGKIRDAYWRIRLLNHPDEGGSPSIAARINEAKGLLEGQAKK
ncbi:mitochondrial import inner membrane translocase subunit TIM14-like [Tupaia chinensis]|uniref:mitochondrial import inner membrane translocase subunit TIM14-like n=1 Tax=Tupaia chinensis TaxID=246437 RepID=UPI0003C918B4|nr:mitochondrial import inner membrane translocase subunit TIM14-like [Tupaia chinensis]